MKHPPSHSLLFLFPRDAAAADHRDRSVATVAMAGQPPGTATGYKSKEIGRGVRRFNWPWTCTLVSGHRRRWCSEATLG